METLEIKPGCEIITEQSIRYLNNKGDVKVLERGSKTFVKMIVKDKIIVEAEGHSFILEM